MKKKKSKLKSDRKKLFLRKNQKLFLKEIRIIMKEEFHFHDNSKDFYLFVHRATFVSQLLFTFIPTIQSRLL